jgi:hypothetical protein
MRLAVPPDYEERAIESARALLQDIPPCRDADYRILWIMGAPTLVLAFHLPETRHQPACAIRLTTAPRMGPLEGGTHLDGDRLRRHVRDSIEQYLLKCGIRLIGLAP